ncbi:hypothetical protein C5S35_15475, partial [Candidatus Methanophagaceae archaeon]
VLQKKVGSSVVPNRESPESKISTEKDMEIIIL